MLRDRLSGSKWSLAFVLTLMLLLVSVPMASAQEEVEVACPEGTQLLVEFEVRPDGTYEPVGGDPMGVTLTDTAENSFTFESEVPITVVVVRSFDVGTTEEITTFPFDPPTTGPETVEESSILNVGFCVEEDDVQKGDDGDIPKGDTDADDDQKDSELPVTGGVPVGGLSPLTATAAAALAGSGALAIRRRR